MTADSGSYFYEPKSGHGLAHDPFKAIVAPRPIGWITTVDLDGRVNLAPYSFFTAVCAEPPMVAFSSQGRKDSLDNAIATGEFVCNLATAALAEAMNQTSAALPRGHSEAEFAGLQMAASRVVRPPRVRDSPSALECRLATVVPLHDADGRETRWHLAIGEVVGVHLDESLLRDGLFDTAAARPLARDGYRGDYSVVTETFEMLRPSSGWD